MSESRVLLLENVHNFRDYGGYGVVGGGLLRSGLLWRSGQHVDASEDDLARIDALRLVSVFDLRTAHERQTAPCRRPSGFAGEVFFIDDLPSGIAPHLAALRNSGVKRSARERMRASYSGMPFRPQLNAMIRRYFAELAGREGASLVNCMAGKDRTGFTVAMLHYALGVHPDDIMADYLLTNTAGDTEARIRAGIPAIQSSATGRTVDEETLRVLMGVEAEYLDTALAAIREQHGTIDTYLAEVLGADAAVREHLADKLVER
jgi:protein-tyrosine phosphatase